MKLNHKFRPYNTGSAILNWLAWDTNGIAYYHYHCPHFHSHEWLQEADSGKNPLYSPAPELNDLLPPSIRDLMPFDLTDQNHITLLETYTRL